MEICALILDLLGFMFTDLSCQTGVRGRGAVFGSWQSGTHLGWTGGPEHQTDSGHPGNKGLKNHVRFFGDT